MKVHQIKWHNFERNILYFNTLSCFTCKPLCSHYHLAKVDYSETTAIRNVETTDMCVLKNPIVKDDAGVQSAETTDIRVLKNSIVEGGWVVVRFEMKETNIRVNENDTFLITFLRAKNTREHSGFIYSFLDLYDDNGKLKEDVMTVYKTQLLYSVLRLDKNFNEFINF